MQRHILVINPGSTSTKIAHAIDGVIVDSNTIIHSPDELQNFATLAEQMPFRLRLCSGWVKSRMKECSAVAAMGGLLKPVCGGVYRVDEAMLEDARKSARGEHASNLGCQLAAAMAEEYGCPAFIVDPVSVDEFEPLAYYSGHPLIKRNSLSHALNIHAAARRAAAEMALDYPASSFIIAHIGGGISIAPVKGGRIIDVNDAASDGPFSPERTGGLPLQPFIGLCVSGNHTERQLRKMVMGEGGLVAYLGTNSLKEVEERIAKGDLTAREAYEAMAYQIAKEIGAMAAVLCGNVDAIVITGGAARSAMLMGWITERVSFIAPVKIYPGEEEMASLAAGAMRVLNGEEEGKEY